MADGATGDTGAPCANRRAIGVTCAVRDDLMRAWRPSPDGRYTTGNGRHHATWDKLRAQHDLVEVTEARMAQATLWGTP